MTRHMRLYWRKLGGHYHCRLFSGNGKSGDLVFDEREWPHVLAAFEVIAQVAEDEAFDCDCRNRRCGHKASKHVGEGGACIEPGCPCGPGGWQ